jgi:hypothetical protein
MVLHPVSDLATATAVDVAVLGVAPHTDGASYVGFEAAGQHVGHHQPLQPAERHDPAGFCG